MAPQPLLGDGRGGETGDAALRLRSGGGQLDVGHLCTFVYTLDESGVNITRRFGSKWLWPVERACG